MSTVTTPIVSRAQLLEAVPGLKERTLAYLLRNRHSNGLAEAGAVLRPGKEFLFDLDAFVGYLRTRRG